jgi:hypothetical protein
MDQLTSGATEWNNWEQLPGNDFVHQVQRGRMGKNVGLRNGLSHINNYLYGTHKARYYLIGADSGVGKTTLADFMFVLQAYKSAKALNRPLRIFYLSFEISKADKIARWTSYYVFTLCKIRLPSDYILGRIEGLPLSDEDFKRIKEAHIIVKQMFEECVTFIDMMMTPDMIFHSIIEGHFEKRGKVIRDAKSGQVMSFIPDNPDFMTMLLVDHIALTDNDKGERIKDTMDSLSRHCVVLRNIFQATIVVIQQFSTDMLAANRAMHTKKTGVSSIAPTRLDFGDSKSTYRDANAVIGAICPGQDLAECIGYDLAPDKLGRYLILLFIMKNRDGKSGRFSPVFMDPVTGIFADIQYPAHADTIQTWYNEAQKIDKLCQAYSPQIS